MVPDKKEKERTLELCSAYFGKVATCLLFARTILLSLDLHFLSCKVGMIIIALVDVPSTIEDSSEDPND